MTQPRKQHSKKRTIFIAVAIVALLVAAGITLWARDRTAQPSSNASTTERNDVNYDPPSEEEQKAGDEQKEKIDDQTQQQPATSANLIITNTSQGDGVVRVRAIVTNSVENGGTCTTTLRKDESTVSMQTQAFADASSIQCGAIDFKRNEFDKTGEWKVTVEYKSDSLQGSTSGTITLE